jgi:hypothetical protein
LVSEELSLACPTFQHALALSHIDNWRRISVFFTIIWKIKEIVMASGKNIEPLSPEVAVHHKRKMMVARDKVLRLLPIVH